MTSSVENHEPFVGAPDEARVIFHHLVVRTPALAGAYPGGLDAFVAKHAGVRLADGIAVWCAMAGQDMAPMVSELEEHGLGEGEIYMGVWDGMYFGPPGPEEEVTLTPWLRGRIVGGDMWVSHSD